jgi:triosephosphate isomerase
MYRTPGEARALAREIANGRRGRADRTEVAVCPAFPCLPAVAEVLHETTILWGAQNCAPALEGAFTGEVSVPMLVDLGCRFVILGHSERRRLCGETDALVREKLDTVLGAGLTAIVCVGETLEEREAARTEEVVERQIRSAFSGIPGPEVARTVVAYEPVWAIGTGRNATPEMAEAVHRRIRVTLSTLAGEPVAGAVRILYGGSLKPDNARAIFEQPNVDGGLVGGASLEAKSFLAIVGAA